MRAVLNSREIFCWEYLCVGYGGQTAVSLAVPVEAHYFNMSSLHALYIP